MKTIEHRYMDKSEWGAGPWQDEPDKLQFPDPQTGLPCLIVRAPATGSLCGYVGVTAGHPMFERTYSADELLTVHGGLTFSDFCSPGEPEHGICHVVEAGEDGRVWWLGFDCAHGFDFAPAMEAFTRKHLGENAYRFFGAKYRDVNYVKRQCASLAAQLGAMK